VFLFVHLELFILGDLNCDMSKNMHSPLLLTIFVKRHPHLTGFSPI